MISILGQYNRVGHCRMCYDDDRGQCEFKDMGDVAFAMTLRLLALLSPDDSHYFFGLTG